MAYPTHLKQLQGGAENGIDTLSLLHGLRSTGLNRIDLSIIIVNYKCWDVLGKCLDSFNLYSPKLNYETIVVDNDSQDNKLKSFSQEYPDVKFIENSGNYGFSSASNLGADKASGDYLLFLNPDIVLTDSPAIDEMVSFSKNNSNVGITSCRTIYPNGKLEREIAFISPWLTTGWIRTLYKLALSHKISTKFPQNDKIWYPEWVAGSVILIKRSFFKEIGRWDQNNFWMYSEDPDLCLKVTNKGKKNALLRNVQLEHMHGGSSRRNPKTTAITKSEVVTSSHVFINIHTKGANRMSLHIFIIINTLISWLLRTIITMPIFWTSSFKSNILTLIEIIKYYVCVPIRGTWKSKRLIADEYRR